MKVINHPNHSKTWLALACLITACLAIHGCASDSTTPAADGKGGGGRAGGRGAGGGPPVPVVVTKVSKKNVPIELTVVGNVEAYATINILPQVGGQLTEVRFQEGDYVKKDDLLFRIDRRPMEAQIQQLEANLARDQALLSQTQFNLARDTTSQQYASGQADRYAKLFQEGVVSKEQGDQLRSTADTLAQSVAADRAAIQSSMAQIDADKAQISNSRIQLGFTEIRSPIEGRTGNLMIKQGSVISANTSTLVAIAQIQPIYVTFAVPEARLTEVKRYMDQSKLPVTAKLQDGAGTDEHGELTFVDNNVDMTTGTIKLKGTFQNADHKLWPGQYVNVVMRLTTQMDALVLPNQAVQSGQDGTFVYVVKEDRSVEARPVTTGARVDQDLVITKGLEDGETVVTEGQLRLAPNSRVTFGGGRGGPGGGRGEGPGGGRGQPGEGQGRGGPGSEGKGRKGST